MLIRGIACLRHNVMLFVNDKRHGRYLVVLREWDKPRILFWELS